MPGENQDQPIEQPKTTTEHTTTTTTTQPGVVGAEVEQPGAAQGFTDLDAANAEIRKLRAESAGRRVDNRGLQEQIDELKKQVPSEDVNARIASLEGELNRYQAATEAGVSAELLRATERLQKAVTAEEMTAARDEVARLSAPAAQPSPRNPTPPRTPAAAPATVDQQIAAAEGEGKYDQSLRLKTRKLTEGR